MSNPRVVQKANYHPFRFTIDNVQSWDAGSYECIAEVPEFTPKRLLHHLHIKGRMKWTFARVLRRKALGEPMVKLSEETIYRKDDVIELRCEVRRTNLCPTSVP